MALRVFCLSVYRRTSLILTITILSSRFIGTCARKQSFVTTYALFLYFHLVINIIVAAYFLIEITSTANNDITKLCENSLRADQSKDQCKGLLNITKDVFWAAAILVLSIETCTSNILLSLERTDLSIIYRLYYRCHTIRQPTQI